MTPANVFAVLDPAPAPARSNAPLPTPIDSATVTASPSAFIVDVAPTLTLAPETFDAPLTAAVTALSRSFVTMVAAMATDPPPESPDTVIAPEPEPALPFSTWSSELAIVTVLPLPVQASFASRVPEQTSAAPCTRA